MITYLTYNTYFITLPTLLDRLELNKVPLQTISVDLILSLEYLSYHSQLNPATNGAE